MSQDEIDLAEFLQYYCAGKCLDDDDDASAVACKLLEYFKLTPR